MRILFTCVPGHGHLNPLVPLAQALRTLSCDVEFTTGAELAARVEELGFPCTAAGPTLAAMEASALADPDVRSALDNEPWKVAAAIFGRRAQAVLDDLETRHLAPDLVIHDAMEMAGPVIAARHGVPWITHGLGPRWPDLVEDAMPPFVDDTWRRHGLTPVQRGGLGHHVFIEICPPAVRSDNRRDDHRVMERRSVALAEPGTTSAQFGDGNRPRIYCTLGTFSNGNVAVFRSLLDALAVSDVDALITTGGRISRNDLHPIPSNVTVADYVPQAHVLRLVDAVVCHGGSGTMLAALAEGRPIVAMPQGADQFINLPWWMRSGAVKALDPQDGTANSIASAVSTALQDPAMRRAAEASARAIAAMPSPSEVAQRLIHMAGV